MKLCLAIGVANSWPLEYLPAAITAAKEVGHWAAESGYQTEVVTDESEPVTLGALREVLEKILPKNSIVDSLVLHFAGHGFRDGAANNIWLQSDWHKEMRAISVEGLRQRLYQYPIKNLTIFSDACRSLPDRLDIAQTVADPILGRGPIDPKPPIIDRFNAVADGLPAYMVSGGTSSPRCVFSTVLIEALWGHHDAAFDKYIHGQVTAESLDLFLKARMKEVGDRYRLSCVPENFAGTPRDHIIYYDKGQPRPGRPPAPQWPIPSFEQQHIDDAGIERIDLRDTQQLKSILGPDFGRNNPAIDAVTSIKRLPKSAQQAVNELAAARIAVEKSDESSLGRSQAEWNVARAQNRVEQVVVGSWKKQKRLLIRKRFRVPEEGFREGNLLVRGGVVKAIWSERSAIRVSSYDDLQRFAVVSPADHASQILVEFADGLFASAVVYGRLITVLTRGKSNSIGWTCADPWNDPDWRKGLDLSSRAVADLQLGDMTPEAVDTLAAKMRATKHVNPTLGAIAAYLYDYSGDIDSIRRMAYFYCSYSQSIPFDIAFMGIMPLMRSRRTWEAIVPPVPLRNGAQNNPKLPSWVSQATPEGRGRLGGLWPWLRQGWDYVEEPEDADAAAAETLKDVVRFLAPSQFTAFSKEGARLLIGRFELEETR